MNADAIAAGLRARIADDASRMYDGACWVIGQVATTLHPTHSTSSALLPLDR